MEDKLKSISTQDLEAIIAKAISEGLKEEFKATISSIQYGKGILPEMTFQICLSHPIKFREDNT